MSHELTHRQAHPFLERHIVNALLNAEEIQMLRDLHQAHPLPWSRLVRVAIRFLHKKMVITGSFDVPPDLEENKN